MIGSLVMTFQSAPKPPKPSSRRTLRLPSALSSPWRPSSTIPHAFPSGKVSCSSLMNRFFRGKANRTPRIEIAIIQGVACHSGMTLPVTIM